jgi:hypothetical protein
VRDQRSWHILRYQDSEIQYSYGPVCLFSTFREQCNSRTWSKVWNLTVWVSKLIRSFSRILSLTAVITHGLVLLKDISMGEAAWLLLIWSSIQWSFPSFITSFWLFFAIFTIHLFKLAYFLYISGCVAPSSVHTILSWKEGLILRSFKILVSLLHIAYSETYRGT